MKLLHIDTDLKRFETPQGTLTLVSVFIPFFIEMLLMNLMGTVNTVTLGHYSDDAVAAVGAANQIITMVLTFYAVISSGASIVISHNLGAKKNNLASDAAFSAIVFSLLISLLIGTTLTFFSRPILTLMNIKGTVLEYATSYLSICIFFSFMQALISAFSAIFRSYGFTKTAVYVSLFMNAMNAILNIIIVYRPIETPLHGVTGIAIANTISRLLALLLFIFLLMKSPITLNLRSKKLKSLKTIFRILYIGVPGGIGSISYSASQVVSTSIIAILGSNTMSANIYLTTIFFYVYVIGMSLGLAGSLITGWLVGAGEFDKAYRLGNQNLRIAIIMNVIISVSIYLLGVPILGLFTHNPDIISIAKTILLIDIFVEFGRAFNHVISNALRGAGDVLYSMVVSIVSCWAIGILLSYILCIHLGLGLAGCWIAFAIDESFRGLLYYHRFRTKKWTKKALI
ncbi:MAG TPA: MATE family efflux transporter [Lachnospiraceae bacterium]|nr:MATE family efflux transporter [Lachnospiraceae bacterium]